MGGREVGDGPVCLVGEEQGGLQRVIEVENDRASNRFWVRDRNFFRRQGARGRIDPHSSRCPPKAAVRQRAMARNTLRCCQVIHLRLRSMKGRPAARTRSATSRGGRFIYPLCGTVSFSLSTSRGLAVALRCRRERWR